MDRFKTTVNCGAIVKMMGVLLTVIGLCMTLPVVTALIYKEYFEAKCFLEVAVPSIVGGLLLLRFFNPSNLKTKERDGYIIVSLCWIVASLIGMIPMIITGAIPNPADAFFELCSGFSTTGATIVTNVEALPNSVLMWRSFTHWIGGMGIIVFAAALIPSIGIGGQIVASAETPGPVMTKVSPRFSDTAKRLYTIYIIFTVAEIILLLLGGMNLFDSLIHSFGTAGTGGFSNHSDSIGYYNSPYIQWVIIVFMLLCGINFNLYFFILKGNPKEFFKDEELRLYLGTVGLFVAMMTVDLLVQGDYTSISKGIRDAAFQAASIVTTTGYATADYDVWPSFCKMLLVLLMFTGACSSSTGGGIKFIRVLVSRKFIQRGLFNKLHPNRVGDITVNGRGVSQSVITNIINFVFFYMALLLFGTVIVSFNGYDIVTNFSSVLTCLSNVGPGLNLVGPTMNFALFNNFTKVFLAFTMIAGRLELFTFFMLFSPHYWNANRV